MLLWTLMNVAFAEPVVAVVIVDREARDNGYALEIDGWLVDDALPVDVAKGEVLRIVEPDGRTEDLDLAPGEAWVVTGAKGEAWMSMLDEEIRTDLIAVRGDDGSIEALAKSLGAEIVVDDDTIYLAGTDVLFDASWVDDERAREVEEVAFVRVHDDVQREDSSPAPAFRPVGRLVKRTMKTSSEAPASASAAAAPSTAIPSTPKPVGHIPTPVQAPPAAPVVEGTDLEDLERYAGVHLCRDDVLWLDASGVFGFRGVQGDWNASSPGVIRLQSFEGDLWWSAAVDPETGACRDVWNPTETVTSHLGGDAQLVAAPVRVGDEASRVIEPDSVEQAKPTKRDRRQRRAQRRAERKPLLPCVPEPDPELEDIWLELVDCGMG